MYWRETLPIWQSAKGLHKEGPSYEASSFTHWKKSTLVTNVVKASLVRGISHSTKLSMLWKWLTCVTQSGKASHKVSLTQHQEKEHVKISNAAKSNTQEMTCIWKTWKWETKVWQSVHSSLTAIEIRDKCMTVSAPKPYGLFKMYIIPRVFRLFLLY